MPLTLKTKIAKDHIRAEISGERTPNLEAQEGIEIWESILKLSNTTSITKILAIAKIKGRISGTAIYEVAQRMQLYNLKIAGVVPDPVDYSNLSLFEFFASSLEFELKVFNDIGSGENWLLNNKRQ